jgi:hypothetical protein
VAGAMILDKTNNSSRIPLMQSVDFQTLELGLKTTFTTAWVGISEAVVLEPYLPQPAVKSNVTDSQGRDRE